MTSGRDATRVDYSAGGTALVVYERLAWWFYYCTKQACRAGRTKENTLPGRLFTASAHETRHTLMNVI